MKYIFAALLLANIGFVAWQQTLEPDTPGSRSGPTRAFVKGVDPVWLLDEKGRRSRRKAQLDQVVKSPVVEVEVGSGKGSETACVAVGPFQDLFSGQDVVDQLAALDLDVELRAIDRPTGDSDYRVMIPPASSAENAFRKLRELKARNIDSHVITQGPDALAISLGVFSSREAAETVRDERAGDGYEVEITKMPGLNREYWIFAGENKDLQIPEAVWQSLQDEHPDLTPQPMSCRRSGLDTADN